MVVEWFQGFRFQEILVGFDSTLFNRESQGCRLPA